MKATGIVRRIDDLGRVVIPKEIRRTMRIREGDPLEIYTSNEGEVIFKKYSPIGEMGSFVNVFAEALHKTGNLPVIVCDKDHVVAAAGIPKKEVIERRVSPLLEEAMKTRRILNVTEKGADRIKPVEGVERYALVCYPIITSGDVRGCIMFLSGDKEVEPRESQCKLIEASATFIGMQLEG